MANITVSSDVDTMLQSADNAAIRTNISAASQASVDTKQDILTFGTANTNAVKMDNTSAAPGGGDIAIFASTGIMPKTFASLKYDLGVDQKAPLASPTFTGTTTAPTVITGEIQCEGTTSGTAQPIKYDSNEHRFRDYDASPTDLMVIEKIDGYTGGRVGINKDPSASNAVALHVVAGKNASTNVEDLGLKVIGGSFFEDFIRVGHYTDTTRGQISNPTNGTIIYNSEHHEYQGYVGGGSGWKKFTMGNVST